MKWIVPVAFLLGRGRGHVRGRSRTRAWRSRRPDRRRLQGGHQDPARLRKVRDDQGARADPGRRDRRQADAEAGLDHRDGARTLCEELSLLSRRPADRGCARDHLERAPAGRLLRRVRVRRLPGGQPAGGYDAVFPDPSGLREGRVRVDRGSGCRAKRAPARSAGHRTEAACIGQEGREATRSGRWWSRRRGRGRRRRGRR